MSPIAMMDDFTEDVTVIAVEIRFKGKTATDRAKHIEALMKLLDRRARSYKLTSFRGRK